MGYDSHTRLTPLTTDFHEFVAQVSSENAEVLQYGPFFQWSGKVRQEHNVPMGPLNPQALNRYSYVLNNPLRYVDPTGHESYQISKEDLLKLQYLLDMFKANLEGESAIYSGVAAGAGGTSVALGTAAVLIPGSQVPLGIGAGVAGGVSALAGLAAAADSYAVSELDSMLTNINQAIAIADKSGGFATIEMSHTDIFGSSADFGCDGCTTITTIGDYYFGGGRNPIAAFTWAFLGDPNFRSRFRPAP